MPQGSALVTFVVNSTSPRVAGREIIIGDDGRSYYIARYSSATTIVANMPREFDSVTSKAQSIVQPVYNYPLMMDRIESIVDMSNPADLDGSLDFMGRREKDRTYPTTAGIGTPVRYSIEDDGVTTYGSGTVTIANTGKHLYFSSAALNYKDVEQGQIVTVGSHTFTINYKVSGSHVVVYEPAREAISGATYSLEIRKRKVRLHPSPEDVLTYQVHGYKREVGLLSDSDSWGADPKWHSVLKDGVAAKVMAEMGRETAPIYQKRYETGLAIMKRECNKSPDDTERQMKVDIVKLGYRDTWK
jgi:hypothetical protein